MSEKNVWKWLRKKGVRGVRLEHCTVKGVPDTLLWDGAGRQCLVELKDWSGKKKHPLSVEQQNILTNAGGFVLIKLPDRCFSICFPGDPLLVSDIGYARGHGNTITVNEFTPEALWSILTQ